MQRIVGRIVHPLFAALAVLSPLLVIALPLQAQGGAGAAAGSGGAGERLAELADTIREQSTFCDGTYALCIKAPCSAIPTIDRLANYAVNYALCSCDVVQGWSMGPGACVDRAPVKKQGKTYLISTYSNADNSTEKTLSCPKDTTWAWCYGAPCVVDDKAPNKAVCTCPVMQGPSRTLGGNCEQGACQGIWSAATPAGDLFANDHYYSYMHKNEPSVQVNKAAAACPVTTAPAHP
ncbi:MAG TPA: hypothetical protein VKY89_06700 [Thermoanaerobaculia bacterium]|jgi:hypothetical protein|nr:hypothetical protein [Thermoanaerobaculia bacterium]